MSLRPVLNAEISAANELQWYCLRSQPKHEHIAAARLRRELGIEVFCPRVRLQRRTQRGLKWFVEAMFPNYLFARFDLTSNQTRVRYSPGISDLVHFGRQIAPVPAAAIEELAGFIGGEEIRTLECPLAEGADVAVISGPLTGQEGVITKILPARARVRVLLEFLGDPREIELGLMAVFPANTPLRAAAA
jgi:transcriptional antiterminator RfaH